MTEKIYVISETQLNFIKKFIDSCNIENNVNAIDNSISMINELASGLEYLSLSIDDMEDNFDSIDEVVFDVDDITNHLEYIKYSIMDMKELIKDSKYVLDNVITHQLINEMKENSMCDTNVRIENKHSMGNLRCS